MSFSRNIASITISAAVMICAPIGTLSAQELIKVRVGNPSNTLSTFMPTRVGIEKGIFKKHGLDVESLDLGGGGKVQQALAGNAIDMSTSGAPEIAALVRGNHAKVVAALTNEPRSLGIFCGNHTDITTVDQLKGKRIGLSSIGSLSDWLTREVSKAKGWGPTGMESVSIGATTTEVQAVVTGQVDCIVTGPMQADMLGPEGENKGRWILSFADVVKDFQNHFAYANSTFVKEHPDAVKKFVAAWLESVQWMKDNREETVSIMAAGGSLKPEFASRNYDVIIPMYNMGGKFNQTALDKMEDSLVELKLLDTKPDLSQYVTEEFLPQ